MSTVTVATRHASGVSFVCAVALAATISAVSIIIAPGLSHWMIIPVTAAGALAAVDLVDWARGIRETFDPQALLGLFGLHFFQIAPILHIALDYWTPFLPTVPDPRSALGYMACINTAGLIVYRLIVAIPDPTEPHQSRRVNVHGFVASGLLVGAIGIAAFGYLVTSHGGPTAYLTIVTRNQAELAGSGPLLLVAESWPLVLAATALVHFKDRLARSAAARHLLIASFAVVQFAVGGLRGSRSNTIWPILVVLILIHLLVTPISRRSIAASGLMFLAFMYGYGVYKSAGISVVSNSDQRSISELADRNGRTFTAMMLGDLGRADVQATLADRQRAGAAPMTYGETYLGDLLFLIPRQVRPETLADKAAAGTDLLYGVGSYGAGYRSSHIYGLAGEGLLNFGPVGAVLVFGALGVAVRWTRRRWHLALHRGDTPDSSCFAAAVGGVAVILMLGSDLDNVLWFCVKTALPLIAVSVCATNVFRNAGPP